MSYDIYLDKLVVNSIETKGYMVDMIAGMKELSGKLDALIALQSAAIQPQQQQQ